MPVASEVRTSRGRETRTRILETALRLFKEHGYEQTTMRVIASEAGVALGNAYYYFESKEHLIQAFYGRTHEEHLQASRDVLDRERTLKTRLLGVMHTKFDTLAPYRRFAILLFKTAADPRSPLNPFSPESLPVRQEATQVYEEVLAGSKEKLPKDLLAELPNLLWLYHMGVVLFWIHDTSPDYIRTRRFVDRSVELVTRVIALASLAVMRPVRRVTLKLLAELQEGDME